MIPKVFADYVTGPVSQTVRTCPAAPVAPPRFILTAQEAQEDFEVLRYILDTSYSGREYWQQNGVDFAAAYGEISAYIEAQGDQVPVAELGYMFHDALRGIHDGHLALSGALIGCLCFDRSYSAYFSDVLVQEGPDGFTVAASRQPDVRVGQRLTGQGLEAYLFPTLSAPGTKQYLVGMRSWEEESALSLELDGQPVVLALHPCRVHADRPDFGLGSLEELEGYPVLHSSRFWTADGDFLPREQEWLEQIGASLRERPAVIWDLLSNEGGNSHYPQAFVRGLNGDASWPLDCGVLSSPAIRREPVGQGERSWTFYPAQERDLSRALYRGRLYVLVSDKVGSSGEAAVSMAKNVPGCVLVGQNTGGRGVFGETRPYELPHSRMVMVVPQKLFLGGAREGEGYAPDFWLDTVDVLGEIVRWLQSPAEYSAVR